jgi:hypothetical protein
MSLLQLNFYIDPIRNLSWFFVCETLGIPHLTLLLFINKFLIRAVGIATSVHNNIKMCVKAFVCEYMNYTEIH